MTAIPRYEAFKARVRASISWRCAVAVWMFVTWPVRALWRWFKCHRSARAVLIYTPVCVVLLMFAMSVGGIEYADQRAYLMEMAPKSGYVVGIIAIGAGWMALTGMDLANSFRSKLQRILIDEERDKDGEFYTNRAWFGAMAILAGESLAWAYALYQVGRMMLKWQPS